MPSNNTDFHYVNFNKYTRKPVREDEFMNRVFNGHDNINYTYIIDRYNGSTTNKAVNNAYIKLAYGRGLGIHGKPEDDPKIKEFLEIMNKTCLKNVLKDNQILSERSYQIHRQTGDKGKIAKLEHIDKSKVIPSIVDDEGVIRSYWYSLNWLKQYDPKYRPVQYPAFPFGADFDFELPEIYVGKEYQIGEENYFAKPDYDACLQYAELEEEISNYYVSHVKNGLSFGTIVNVPNSNGWDDAMKQKYKADVLGDGAGSSNAGRIVFAFLDFDSDPTSIENVENNTAHEQWGFLSKEATEKILAGHLCPSPSLVGISAVTGFSSKAEEMDTMEQQLLKRIIAPKQDQVLDDISEIMEYFKLDFTGLYFRPLTEIEGEMEEANTLNDNEDGSEATIVVPVDEETLKAQASLRGSVGGVTGILGIQTSVSEGKTDFKSAVTILMEIYGFSEEVSIKLLGSPDLEEETEPVSFEKKKSDLDLFLQLGEDEDLENFDIVDENEVDYDEEDKLELVKTGTARPNSKSSQDRKDFVVRYRYVGRSSAQMNPKNDRPFCIKMMAANKVYRKEDITQLKTKIVNTVYTNKDGRSVGWGPNGAKTYSIWLYKGGGNCHHKWNRVIYLKKGNSVDVNSPLAEIISTSKARREGFKLETNNTKVSVEPRNMTNEGFLKPR
jgi:hypothetical protein